MECIRYFHNYVLYKSISTFTFTLHKAFEHPLKFDELLR